MQLLSIIVLCVLPFIIDAAESRGSILKVGDFYLEVEPGTTVQQAQETIRKNAPADETFDQFFCTPEKASRLDTKTSAYVRMSLLIELCVQASQKSEYIPHVAKVLKRIHKQYGPFDWKKIDDNTLSITPKDLEYRLLCAIPVGPQCPPISSGGRYVWVNGKKFGMYLTPLHDMCNTQLHLVGHLLQASEHLEKDVEHHGKIVQEFERLLSQLPQA